MYLAQTLVIHLQHSKGRTTKADKKSEKHYTATTNSIEVRNGAGYLGNSDAAQQRNGGRFTQAGEERSVNFLYLLNFRPPRTR
jgi:hypothetical protein